MAAPGRGDQLNRGNPASRGNSPLRGRPQGRGQANPNSPSPGKVRQRKPIPAFTPPTSSLTWSRESNSFNPEWNCISLVKFIPVVSDSYLPKLKKPTQSLHIAPESERLLDFRTMLPVDNIAHCVSFVGPTHAGKSTLVRALMGLDPFGSL
jgi:hypothetical protein